MRMVGLGGGGGWWICWVLAQGLLVLCASTQQTHPSDIRERVGLLGAMGGVATVSRIDKIVGLFFRISSIL